MSTSNTTFKCLLVGDGAVGKSCFVNRHATGQFERKYLATVGLEVTPLTFTTTKGEVTFNVWDCAGQEKYSGLRDGYYLQADCAIVMFDVNFRPSYHHVKTWIEDITRVNGAIPIVICGNKCDSRERVVQPDQITIHRQLNLPYYDISAKTNYNYEKPFTCLLKQLTEATFARPSL